MNAPCFAPTQFRLLQLLTHGPAAVPALSRVLGLHRETTRAALCRLRDRDLVEQDGDTYSVTGQGRRAVAMGLVATDYSRPQLRLSARQERERAREMAWTLSYAKSRNLSEAATEYVLRLTFPGGMTEAETARYLGITHQAVNRTTLRALGKLKQDSTLRELARD